VTFFIDLFLQYGLFTGLINDACNLHDSTNKTFLLGALTFLLSEKMCHDISQHLRPIICVFTMKEIIHCYKDIQTG